MMDIKNGDYCGIVGFLTGMCYQDKREEIPVNLNNKPVNVTININLQNDKTISVKNLINSIVDGLR